MNDQKGYIVDEDTAYSIVEDMGDVYQRYFGYPYQGLFVEVGAFDGYSWSYTRCLAQAGWRGLLIEPQPEEVARCRQLYKDNPNIQIVEGAAGNRDVFTKLYKGGSLSTVREDMIPLMNNIINNVMSPQRFDWVHMFTLNQILSHRGWPYNFDLLVVDVEGAEQEVLEGFSINWWKPTMCIIEACDPCNNFLLLQRTNFVLDYFAEAGYTRIISSGTDMVFVREVL